LKEHGVESGMEGTWSRVWNGRNIEWSLEWKKHRVESGREGTWSRVWNGKTME